MKNKPILVIAGEPFSIFSEIFFKTIKRINKKNNIILIGSKKLLKSQMKILGYNFNFNEIDDSLRNYESKKNLINIINVDFKFNNPFKYINDDSNYYIGKCFKVGINLINKKLVSGLINGPISKKNFLKNKYPGITEFLADKTNKKNKAVMLIFNKKLSVSPITTHLPLKDVNKKISTYKIINNVKVINKFYYKTFKIIPKFAITGLNPHCENFTKINEEKKVIIPAIEKLKKSKINIVGPLAADSLFMKNNVKKYDVVIGMYHDQVLTPIKTLFNFDAINITLGLPFIRVSPDHGPNNHMIGQNKSDPKSFYNSLKFLEKFSAN